MNIGETYIFRVNLQTLFIANNKPISTKKAKKKVIIAIDVLPILCLERYIYM